MQWYCICTYLHQWWYWCSYDNNPSNFKHYSMVTLNLLCASYFLNLYNIHYSACMERGMWCKENKWYIHWSGAAVVELKQCWTAKNQLGKLFICLAGGIWQSVGAYKENSMYNNLTQTFNHLYILRELIMWWMRTFMH